jgi:hypothetical protein
MGGATEGSADVSAVPVTLERRSSQRPAGTGGAARRVLSGLADFFLTGLSTMEVIALAVAYVAVMGFLWMSGAAEPERLITHAAFRSAWAIVALALLRPLTWIPYALPFAAFRKLTHPLFAGWRPILRNLAAHLLTIGVLAGALWLLALVVDGAVSAILSGLAFVTGSGSLSTLGAFRGDWNLARIGGVVAMVVVARLVLPPLARDLDLSAEPVLWFGSGGRGRFDRIAFLVVLAGSALLAATGALLAR